MAIDAQDRVWLGSNVELGWLQKTPEGEFLYHSILDLLPKEHRSYGNLYDVNCVGAEVYFSADRKVLRYSAGRVQGWDFEAGRRLFVSSYDDKALYVQARGYRGLLRFVPGCEQPETLVTDDVMRNAIGWGGIVQVLPTGKGEHLLITSATGIGILDTACKPRRLDWPLSEYFAKNVIHSVLRLSDGNIALGTMHKGLVIVDPQGRPLGNYTKAQGVLLDDNVGSLLEQAPGRLWVSSKLGVVELDLRPGITRHDERTGLAGRLLSFRRLEGHVYLGLDTSLCQLGLSKSWDKTASVEVVSYDTGYFVNLFEDRGRLLAQGFSGLHYLDESRGVLTQAVLGPVLERGIASPADMMSWGKDGILYLANTALIRFERNGGFWVCKTVIPLQYLKHVLPDPADLSACLCITNETNISRIFPEGPVDQIPQILYARPRSDRLLRVFTQGRSAFALTEKGVLRLEPDAPSFVMAEEASSQTRMWSGGAGERGWVIKRLRVTGGLEDETFCYLLFEALPDPVIGWRESGPALTVLHGLGALSRAFVDEGGFLWIAGPTSILRVDTNRLKTSGLEPAPRVAWQSVRSDQRALSLLSEKPELISETPSVEFEWCAPRRDLLHGCLFQSRLLGESESWGGPSVERRRQFQRLDGGTYRFEVRALDVLGQAGPALGFDFIVQTPWYQTWLAKGGGLVVFALFMYGLVKWRTWKLRQEQVALEHIVAGRTRELLTSNAMLHKATDAKTDFVRTVSHELRTPLAGARMMSELLLRTSLEERQREQAEKLRGCVNYLSRLLDNTLDYARLESGQVSCVLTRFDLYPLLRDTAALFEVLAEQKGLAYELSFPSPDSVWCQAEATHLQRVLVNFLGNAFKFTYSGSVSFRVLRVPDSGMVPYYRIEISDTGRGVDPALRARLFTPFVRNTSAREESSEQGAGMGLALCKRLADLSGARIGYSEPERGGSCFWVEWPLLPASADPEEPAVGELDFSGMRVLVVEDDQVQRQGLDQLLQQLGVSAALAGNCDEAEQQLCKHPFDLALVDYNLGEHTARNLLDRCRLADFGRHKAPVFHLMTAQNLEGLMQSNTATGFAAFHMKPISLSLLYSILAHKLTAKS